MSRSFCSGIAAVLRWSDPNVVLEEMVIAIDGTGFLHILVIMRIYNYTVIFEKEKEGGYHVFCPALSGCHTQAETFDEAVRNIKDAIILYIESLKAHHEHIPEEDITIKPLKITV